MKNLSKVLFLFVFMLCVQSMANFKPYSKEVYDSALKSGQTVILDFHASWCPVCRKQEPLLNDIINMKDYEKFVALKVDYDNEKELKRSLKVSNQSTIVVFKTGKEVVRKIGLTSKEDLKKLIDMGL